LGCCGRDTWFMVEIIPPLLTEYLHYFCLNFKLNLYLVEMVEVSEIFFL
jgi:hypothetical protein